MYDRSTLELDQIDFVVAEPKPSALENITFVVAPDPTALLENAAQEAYRPEPATPFLR